MSTDTEIPQVFIKEVLRFQVRCAVCGYLDSAAFYSKAGADDRAEDHRLWHLVISKREAES